MQFIVLPLKQISSIAVETFNISRLQNKTVLNIKMLIFIRPFIGDNFPFKMYVRYLMLCTVALTMTDPSCVIV